MKKLIFASGNKGKIEEVRKIFEPAGFNIISLFDLNYVTEIEETGTTFEENALIKAQTIFNKFKSPVIADDSGLAIEQLDGKPGINSARYAGNNATFDDNNNKVLKELSDFPEPHPAKFICCALFYEGKSYKTVYGILPGKIIMSEKGMNGFGYDPIFLPDGYSKTLAEMTIDQKNQLSHRAVAFNKLKQILTVPEGK